MNWTEVQSRVEIGKGTREREERRNFWGKKNIHRRQQQPTSWRGGEPRKKEATFPHRG